MNIKIKVGDNPNVTTLFDVPVNFFHNLNDEMEIEFENIEDAKQFFKLSKVNLGFLERLG